MEKDYDISKTSASSKNSVLAHRLSFTSNTVPIVSFDNKKAFRSSFSGKNKAPSQVHGNPSSFAFNYFGAQTFDYRKKPTADSIAAPQEDEFPLFNETAGLANSMHKSYSVNQEIEKRRSTTDSKAVLSEEELKEKLAASLSPSPFRNEDPSKKEERLEKLVASSPPTTKAILFYPFYGTEQMGAKNHHAWKIALKDHIVHTFESISLIKKLRPVPAYIIEKKKLPADTWTSKKLLVFDLDETLVHCVTDNLEKADNLITVILNKDDQIKAGINIRPHAIECLKTLTEYYELIVFTASHPNYADVVIDLIDPDKKIFSKRLFRNSCIRTDINLFIKDLRILGKDLRSVIIVDNSIFSFAFQLDNGVPIIPFYDDKEDCIMPKIRDYLISLKDLEDIRAINTRTFSLTELYRLDISSFLKYYQEEKKEEAKIEESKESEGRGYNSMILTSSEDALPKKKSAQELVEDCLGKFRESLPKYLASQSKTIDCIKETKHNNKK
eukprot:TRINITY_DN7849_c0_g1_i2.p1 TRINITY_DN7849_c0_g1~~TRINITY_DN7849_c0_g1_i2.p1  ORF type:complete len:498 (-),score=152.55 TRINITY_DN7849_c0_g1_i2:110-1603(-)